MESHRLFNEFPSNECFTIQEVLNALKEEDIENAINNAKDEDNCLNVGIALIFNSSLLKFIQDIDNCEFLFNRINDIKLSYSIAKFPSLEYGEILIIASREINENDGIIVIPYPKSNKIRIHY